MGGLPLCGGKRPQAALLSGEHTSRDPKCCASVISAPTCLEWRVSSSAAQGWLKLVDLRSHPNKRQ